MRPFVLSLLLAALALPALAADPQIAITIKNHQYVPSEVPLPGGTRVELVIKNEQPVNAEFESSVLHRESARWRPDQR